MTHTTDAERAHALAEKHGATSYRNRADTSNPAFGFTLGQLEALISEVEQAARRAPTVPETIEQRAQKLKGLQVLIGATAGVPEAIHLARSRFIEAYGRSPLHDDLAYACLLIDAYGGAPAVPVPQGWKLVPDANNMTDEQAEAICNLVSCCGGGAHEVYAAALAAAPQPPEAQASVSNGTLAAHVMLPCVERIDVLEVAKELKENISAFGDTKGKAKEKAAFYLVSQHEQLLYWQQQVRELMASHDIQEQST